MAFTRTASGLCVANLHATNDRPELRDRRAAARRRARRSSGREGSPLIFGGDLNLRPSEHPAVFDELREPLRARPTDRPATRSTICSPAGSRSPSPRQRGRPERRELRENGRALRLSDHAPVNAAFLLR